MKKVKAQASELINQGYQRTSNSGRIITRIDNVNWKDRLKKKNLNIMVDADLYKRVYSNDRKIVSCTVFKLIPSSCHDKIGCVKIKEEITNE